MKAVLFDFGGTLDSNGIACKELLLPIYRKAGVSLPQEKFDRAFYDADDNLPSRHNLKGLGLQETMSLQIADFLDNAGIPSEDIHHRVTHEFITLARRHFAANIPLLRELKKKYRLGIVSNFFGNMDSVLQSEGLAELFDAVADSGTVGHTKPDSRLFMHALNQLGAEPNEAAMVGDSVKRDMAGAHSLGMKKFLLWGDRTGHETPPSDPPGMVILSSLRELSGKLNG